MTQKITLLLLVFISINVFSQKDLTDGFLILESNDTITGKLKDKNYFRVNKVRLYQNDIKLYPNQVIKEIHIDSNLYVKSQPGKRSSSFFRKEISGSVNLYTFKKRKFLGAYDSDLNMGNLRPSLRLYCDDFPNLRDTISTIGNDNIDDFIYSYNDWKINNPESKSYFENNIHNKPRLNLKVSYLLPGIGVEIGLSEKFSLNTFVKSEVSYSNVLGWDFIPCLENQIRYYHNIDSRKKNNQRTYKYTGNYFCLVQGLYFETRANLVGLEYGWQRIIHKHTYFDIGLGLAKWTTGNKAFTLLTDFEFGFNF
jgi:hypothetical protein